MSLRKNTHREKRGSRRISDGDKVVMEISITRDVWERAFFHKDLEPRKGGGLVLKSKNQNVGWGVYL